MIYVTLYTYQIFRGLAYIHTVPRTAYYSLYFPAMRIFEEVVGALAANSLYSPGFRNEKLDDGIFLQTLRVFTFVTSLRLKF